MDGPYRSVLAWARTQPPVRWAWAGAGLGVFLTVLAVLLMNGVAGSAGIAVEERAAVPAAGREAPEKDEYLVRDYRAFLAPESAEAGAGPGATLVDLAVKVGFVVALIVGLSWVLRRSNGLTARSEGGSRNLRRLESLRISPQASVHIVEVGQRVLVLGVTGQQVSLLVELEAEETASPPLPGTAVNQPSLSPFRAWYEVARGKAGPHDPNSNPNP